jgi:glycine oxidase
MQNIAILGAGLTGRLLSLLLKDKYQVTLFERKTINHSQTTGRLAAAMVAPTAESVIASPNIVKMGMASTQLWPQLLSALDLPELYQQNGTLAVAHRNDMNDLHHFQQRLKQLGERSSNIDHQEIEKIEPDLAQQFNSAVFIANEGHVDNFGLFDHTERKLRNSNLHIEEHAEVEIADVKTQFDLVIDCRGIGAKNQIINEAIHLRGVRGEVARVRAPEVKLTRPIRLMHPRYPIYIAPKPNHEYVIGATEIESEDDKQPTLRSAMELLSAAYTVHKGFAEAEIISIQSGLRPTLADNEPHVFIDNNLIQVNGLYRHGYLLSPYIIQQVLVLIGELHGTHNLNYSELFNDLDESLITKSKEDEHLD